jgi:hypothetical protein
LLYNYHSRESLQKIFLIFTLFTAFTTILYWLFPDWEIPCVGKKLLGLGFVTDKETEDFHSELPSSVAVLLAVRDCPHSSMKEKTTVCFVSLEDRLHFL